MKFQAHDAPGDQSGSSAIRALLANRLPQQIEWETFLRFCARNHIEGYVYREVKRLGARLPQETEKHFQHLLFKQTHHNERLLSFLARVDGLFDFPWMLLKGPHVAVEYCGGLHRRHIADLDILVSPAHWTRAEAVLSSVGLRCESRFLLGRRWSLPFLHALEFQGDGYRVDLHRRLRVLPWLNLREREFWERSRNWSFRGRSYRVPDAEGTLLLYLLGLHDDLGRGDWKWKTWVDLMHLLKAVDRQIDWASFFRRRGEEGIGRMSFAVIGECLQLFDSIEMEVRNHIQTGSPNFSLSDVRSPLSSRLLWARLFDAPSTIALGWWFLSLPVRYFAHR